MVQAYLEFGYMIIGANYRNDSLLNESKEKIHLEMNLFFCYNMREVIKCFSFFFYDKYVAIIGDIVDSKKNKRSKSDTAEI